MRHGESRVEYITIATYTTQNRMGCAVHGVRVHFVVIFTVAL